MADKTMHNLVSYRDFERKLFENVKKEEFNVGGGKMKIIRFILLDIYLFGICGNSPYGKGWLTDFLFLIIVGGLKLCECMKERKSKPSARRVYLLEGLGGIFLILYAHYFIGSNGIRNPYGLYDRFYYSIIYWVPYLIMWVMIAPNDINQYYSI